MERLFKLFVRPLVLGPVVLALLAGGVAAIALRREAPGAGLRAVAPESRAIGSENTRLPRLPTPAPKPAPKPAPRKAPVPAPRVPASGPADLAAFRGLGAWVDLYDYGTLEPEASVAHMDAHGVRTVYLQTARWNEPDPASSDVLAGAATAERWVHAAHRRGLKVVGWYLPAYDDLGRDLRRTIAIATYRTSRGQRFDGLAIDVEYKGQVASPSQWNPAVLAHARSVRAAVGGRYPVAAIVPAPIGMATRPQRWAGFPWRELAAVSDVFMPMSYWTFRDGCPEVPEHCAFGYTKGNIEQVRALTGRPDIPLHVIGGVGNECTTAEVVDFVRAAREAGVLGGSLYDYRTTTSAFWGHLGRLNL